MKKRYKVEINIQDSSIDKDGKLTGEAITWKDDGTFLLYSSDSWSVEQKYLNNLGISLLKKTVDLQDKKVYRFPKLDLPRQKVDLLKDKFNCKVIRNSDSADIQVVSMKFFEKLITREWGSSCTYIDNYNIFKHLKDQDLLAESALAILRDFIANTDENSNVNFKYNKDWRGTIKGDAIYNIIEKYLLNNKIVNNHGGYNSQHDFVVYKENISAYNNILNSTSELILDTDLCNIIDKDLAILDSDRYSEIEKMVTSQDIENRSLALEMLANCNIDKSFDVVSGLYFWHWDWLKATTNWNTVNIKSFKKRMDNYGGSHATNHIHSFNKYLNLLKEDNKLTKFAIDKTRELLYSTLLSTLLGKEASVFSMDLESLKLKPRLLETTNNE